MIISFTPMKKIGFYPIIDRATWLERLLPLGVKTIQLRIKDLKFTELENEIKTAVEISKKYLSAQLFINDEWELAIKYEAFGVHLGQGDISNLSRDNFQSISDAGLRLGVSTHNAEEVERALTLNPSYISIGPIFPTKSKQLPYATHGIEGFSRWRKKLNLPLVALAGVKLENGEELIRAGADGIAMISEILQNENPELRTQEWLQLFEKHEKKTTEY